MLREQLDVPQCDIYAIDLRCTGKGYEQTAQRAFDAGVRLVHARPGAVEAPSPKARPKGPHKNNSSTEDVTVPLQARSEEGAWPSHVTDEGRSKKWHRGGRMPSYSCAGPKLRVERPDGSQSHEEYDLVVLSTGVVPSPGVATLAERLGIGEADDAADDIFRRRVGFDDSESTITRHISSSLERC